MRRCQRLFLGLKIDIFHNHDQQIDAKETLYIQAESLLRLLEGDSELSSSEICLKSGASEVRLGASGSVIKPSGKVHLLAKGVSVAKPIARVGDDHSCPKNEPIPHNGGPVLEGSPVSKANSQPIARVGDPLHCDSSKDTITKGIPTITADDKPIAIETSQTDHGGQIKEGSPNVYVGKSQGKTITLPPVKLFSDQCTTHQCQLTCEHNRINVADKSYRLQVIASDKKPDKLNVNYAGTCQNGKNDCPQLLIISPDGERKTQKSAEVSVCSKDISVTKDFTGFFEQILLPNSQPSVYTIKVVTCHGVAGNPITVDVFAPVSWEGKVSLGYRYETQKDSAFNHHQGYSKLKVHGEWALTGEIKVKRNEEEWTLGEEKTKEGGHYKDNPITRQLFGNVQRFLDKIAPKLGSITSDYGRIHIDWPCLELSGGMKNKELEKSHQVDLEGEIKMGMNPLLGIQAEAKVLNWLILTAGSASAGPGGAELAKFLIKVKTMAEKGYDGKNLGAQCSIDVIFTAGAKIEGDVCWKKTAGEPWNAEGEIKGEIPLTLEGHAEGKVRIFKCYAAAGVKAGADSAVGIQFKAIGGKEQPAAYMQFYFNGLTIYYTSYHEYGANDSNTSRSWKENTSSKKIAGKLVKYDNKYKLFEENYWPDKPRKVMLTEGAL